MSADRGLILVLGLAAVVSGSLVLLILAFVAREAFPALQEIGIVRLLSDDDWRPTAGEYGVGPMLIGSLLVTLGAIMLAAPLGVLSALFTRFYAPCWAAQIYRPIVELMAGIPSVVFGFWGLTVLVPLINWIEPPGQSLLAGSLVLTLMVLPTIALTSDAALRSVPREYAQAAAALGVHRWAYVWNVAIPTARRGIAAGMLLAVARAIGETMAVVMVCGNVVQVPGSVFDPMRTVTANIALEMGYATEAHRSALFVTGLMLMLGIAAAITVVELVRPGEDDA